MDWYGLMTFDDHQSIPSWAARPVAPAEHSVVGMPAAVAVLWWRGPWGWAALPLPRCKCGAALNIIKAWEGVGRCGKLWKVYKHIHAAQMWAPASKDAVVELVGSLCRSPCESSCNWPSFSGSLDLKRKHWIWSKTVNYSGTRWISKWMSKW
jgi:hypothetical protein